MFWMLIEDSRPQKELKTVEGYLIKLVLNSSSRPSIEYL